MNQIVPDPGSYQPVSPARPCAVCCHLDDCWCTHDGRVAICSRSSRGALDQRTVAGWVHILWTRLDVSPVGLVRQTGGAS